MVNKCPKCETELVEEGIYTWRESGGVRVGKHYFCPKLSCSYETKGEKEDNMSSNRRYFER